MLYVLMFTFLSRRRVDLLRGCMNVIGWWNQRDQDNVRTTEAGEYWSQAQQISSV
jgi:hypothetical protein